MRGFLFFLQTGDPSKVGGGGGGGVAAQPRGVVEMTLNVDAADIGGEVQQDPLKTWRGVSDWRGAAEHPGGLERALIRNGPGRSWRTSGVECLSTARGGNSQSRF